MSLKDFNPFKERLHIDFIGIGLSILCLIHCLAAPVLLILAPISLPDGFDETFHQMLFPGVGAVALIAGIANYRKSRNLRGLLALIGGIFLLALSFYSENVAGIESYHLILTICGSLLLGWGHWMNYHTCEALRDHEFYPEKPE